MEKIENIKDIDTFYSQKVIPLAFNESLSYMEQICALIDYIENTIVPTLNEHTDAINNLQAYVKMLKDLLDKLNKKVDDNFTTLNTKINTTKEELNTKIDTTKEELNTKIDTTKEELTNIINGINETLTNSINDLDTKVINHINESNERFNNINTQIGTLDSNVTQNTNDIAGIKQKMDITLVNDYIISVEPTEDYLHYANITPFITNYQCHIENNYIYINCTATFNLNVLEKFVGNNLSFRVVLYLGKTIYSIKQQYLGICENIKTHELKSLTISKEVTSRNAKSNLINFTANEKTTTFNIFISTKIKAE